ncbi:MAG TPA: phosphoenolpyruvate kinase [Thermoanaerobaculia bacterium]
MPTSLTADSLGDVFERLCGANLAFARRYPGETGRRQPVHTVYGGAHLFKSDAAAKLGNLALRSLEEYASTPQDLAQAAGLPKALAPTIHARVAEKLRREPVEDFRADFEDGYGNRPDPEEDGHAEAAAREMAVGLAADTLPPFVGIRIKPFTEELRERAVRTLDLFLTTLVRETGGRLPEGFVVTLPKVTIPEHVTALADLFDRLEPALGLPEGALHLEIMIETPQAILNERGGSNLPLLVEAARGRCVAAHFGTYDYTASSNITAAHQTMTHPVCDFAKHMMQVAYAGTGLWISDGATNVLPVPPHRAAKDGPPLTAVQLEENREVVHRAWRLHHDHVRHSLVGGFYQGWDLHPAQLVTRYATVFEFFLEGLDAASDRLRNFVQKAAQATLVGEVFDDAATGQGLLNYFLRAVNCGAITEEEALKRSGLTLEELRGRSFVKILKNRRG